MTMQTDQLFILDRGTVHGPYREDQIECLVSQGQCNLFSKVSSDRASWISVENYLAQRRHESSRKEPFQPPPLPGGQSYNYTSETNDQRLAHLRHLAIVRPFPLFPLFLLHYMTCGVFTFFWITAIHGTLPKTRADDPSGTQAISLCLLPFYNLYWIFVAYPRLGERVNAICRQYRLEPPVPIFLCYFMCVLAVIPAAMASAGLIVLMFLLFSTSSQTTAIVLFFLVPNALTVLNLGVVIPTLAAIIQKGVNQISDAQIVELKESLRK